MWEPLVAYCPLIPPPRIRREHACVKNELVGVINHLLAGVWRGTGVCVHDCVIDLPLDEPGGISGGLSLAGEHDVRKEVSVGYDRVHRI